MTEIFGKDKIIKIDNVDRKYLKKLGEDKLFTLYNLFGY